MKYFGEKTRRSITLITACLCSVMLFACGEKEKPVSSEDSYVVGAEYVYVPEFLTMNKEKFGESGMRQPTLWEGKVYYKYFSLHPVTRVPVTILEACDLETGECVQLPRINLSIEGCDTDLNDFTFDEEGSLYAIWNTYPEYVEGEEYNYEVLDSYLTKHNEAGELLETVCISEDFTEEVNYISEVIVDKDGNVYVSTDSQVYMYDKRLKPEQVIDTGSLYNMFTMQDSVFGVCYDFDVRLVELDTRKGSIKATYGNIPDYGGLFVDGENGKLLYAGSSKLYEYDLEMQESVEVLDWADCYVDGSGIQDFQVLQNGRFAVVYDNYEDSPEVILLTKTPKEQVAEREELTLAVFAEGDWQLQQAVVKFNKSNDRYKVQIKSYFSYYDDLTDSSYNDAMNLLYMDIVSGEAPDIISLRDLDLYNLADSKALEDLTPYLETSTVANKANFEPSILEAYNIEGVQVAVPTTVWLHTLMGKTGLVGEEPGWTIEEIIALRELYPEAILMEHMDRNHALELCLEYGGESFIDYETGTCCFDSEEFMQVLKFAKGFGGYGFVEELYEALQRDEVLLLNEVLTSVEEYQKALLMLEEPAISVGYPTVDGSLTVGLTGWDTYAISTRSDNEDGAWAFIESVLCETDYKNTGFPTRTAQLEEMFAEAMEPVYQLDEGGNILYDENGEPLQDVKTTWGHGNWTAQIYAATEVEIEALRQMIDSARVGGMQKQQILTIVQEEAAAYFAGQKSAEEVAKIIQSRVEICVSENS